MTKTDIFKWFTSNFKVSDFKNSEIHMPCPKCGHENFYFNINKKVGYCHRATCHYKCSLQNLIDKIGYGPREAGYVPEFHNQTEPLKHFPVTLPVGAQPILFEYPNIHFKINDDYSRRVLQNRWKFNNKTTNYWIDYFKIHFTKHSIIIPVYQEGKLVQYVARAIDRSKHYSKAFNVDHKLRYKYFQGIPITNYLYNWDYFKKDEMCLTLVENTFNAIWLNTLGVTTNFGSHLSDNQINQIVKSHIRTVLFIWDEGANPVPSIKKLKKLGVRANWLQIKGQPDDYDRTTWETNIPIIHQEMLEDANNSSPYYLNDPNFYKRFLTR